MKKIKLTFLALVGFTGPFLGQSVISVEAPVFDDVNGSWAAPCVPSGTASAVYHRACYFISQTELSRMALTNSVITSFGIDFFRGASAATVGQFTLYLENTTDVAYNKSLTYSTAISGMATTFTGNLTVPGSGTAVSPTVATSVNLTTPFNYTGGGLYVAWDWYSPTANATTFARALANVGLTSTSAGGYGSAPSSGPAPTALTAYQFRPCMRFNAINTATNDVSVIRLNAPGAAPKIAGAGHIITAQIRNNSVNTLNNVPVTLTITGPNPFTDTQNVPSIAAGGTLNVTFAAYNPTANGQSTMVVTVNNDQYSNNNASWAWTQTVNCSDYANSPSYPATAFDDGSYGWTSGAGCLVTKMVAASNATMTAIKSVVGVNAGNVGLRGILLDASGTAIAATKSLSVTGPAAGSGLTFTTFKFDTAQALTAGSTYYFGIEQLSTGYPFAISEAFNLRAFPNQFFFAPAGGGSIGTMQNVMSYPAMQAVLNYSNTFITASASHTLLCNNKGVVDGKETVTLTAVGTGTTGQTFAWSPGISASITTTSIVVTPSITQVQGFINYTVTATDAPSGCKSNPAVITLSLQNCTGIPDNSGFGASIVAFPNPVVNGNVIIKGLEGKNSISVINMLGQIVYTTETENEEALVDIQKQVAGTYLVKVTSSANQSKIIKLIKE